MKYIIVVGDGMSDYPLDELDGRTPLEAAEIPAMDFIARNGSCGLLKTIPEGFEPGSDVANLAILGYDPQRYYPGGRGPLEARSLGIELKDNEIAIRLNLINEENGRIKDYSSGHISSEEARILIEELDKNLGTEEIKFYPGKSYRHILLLSGEYSKEITCKPPHDVHGEPVSENLPKATSNEGEYTAKILNELIQKSREILNNHPVNQKRIKDGKPPANLIWPWGAGKNTKMPSFRERFNLNGALISAVDLLNGIAATLGMEVIEVPGATAYLDTNYEGKADYALDALERNDLIYIHIEAPDEAGHEGLLENKIKAIEYIDKRVVARILDRMKGKEFTIGILPDHATPLSVKTHTYDPVPFAIYSTEREGDHVENYSESSAEKGSYGLRNATEFMDLLLSKDDQRDRKG